MSAPLIQSLIDKSDNYQIIRDEIAAILLAETVSQQALALAATPTPKNPNLWLLRIYTERSNPWADFIDCPDDVAESETGAPIVNVSFDNASYNMAGSNVFERQKCEGVFHIDVYGYGVSQDDGSTGHIPGDARAALECQRAVKLVRNILMAATYAYLGLRNVVGRRWPQSITMFQPQLDGRTVQQVVAARISLQVDFNEYSPQVEGEIIETIYANVLRKETGQLYFAAQYGEPPP